MHLPAPQRDVRLRHIGAPTRMLSHNLLYPQLSPHLCLPSFVVFNFSLSFLRRLWVSLVSSLQGGPAALQIQSDLRHGMTLASQPWLSSGPGLAAAGQGQSLTLVDHEVQYGNMAYCWRITFIIGSHFSSATLNVLEGMVPLHFRDLSSVPSLWWLKGHFSRMFQSSFISLEFHGV